MSNPERNELLVILTCDLYDLPNAPIDIRSSTVEFWYSKRFSFSDAINEIYGNERNERNTKLMTTVNCFFILHR
jgi:hypothetical protein